VKIVACLAILLASAAWADEAADRVAIEATVAGLNTPPSLPSLFTKDFANGNELSRFLTPFPTVVISREPMGEATLSIAHGHFVLRSVAFVSPDTGVVVAVYERVPVLFVMRREESSWRIASFRVLSEAGPK